MESNLKNHICKKSKAYGELKLIFPTEEYKNQVEEYLKEHFENGELDLSGDGGLDKIKDFDKWLIKIKKDLSKKLAKEEKSPSTLYLAIRKSDNKLIGTIQIRHHLTEKLLKNGGHIGDGVRPSERNKGYATEMIRLALEECKKLGIKRVLMVCYKDNVASRKSIINNGGILENEILAENGKIDQRYWISLKKRYADRLKEDKNVEKIKQKIKHIKSKDFTGDIFLNYFIKAKKPYETENGICIQDTGYKWLEFYDYNSKVKLTAIYDENNKIIEWYFDIARSIGKENNVPYEDDLYLDVVLRPDGEIILLDEDEIKEAYERKEMTKSELDDAYKITNDLIKKIQGKEKKIEVFTDKYLNEILYEEDAKCQIL